jgi:hypothetical protein
MITVQLMGGLGNQLFQIFAAISYAITYKQLFVFQEVVNNGSSTRPSYWGNFLSNLKMFVKQFNLKAVILREKDFEYTPLPKYVEGNIMLFGYYQSYRYFDEYFSSISRMIGLENQKAKIAKDYPMNYPEMISMHFRLGDYKSLQDYHPILPVEYYKNALQFITKRSAINKVLYFCEKDDNIIVSTMIDKLKKAFPNLEFIKASDTLADWEQLLMMSLSRDNIIANSTFSWWGAYFNSNPDKIVCYPHMWFGAKMIEKRTHDLFPNDWNRIEF